MSHQKLTRDGVVAAAIELAEGGGLATVTMRALARHVGVEAMSLYHHFPSKESLLDAMVDVVFSEITLPKAVGTWRGELRRRSISTREVLLRHRWALPLMESRRTPGPATLAYHDASIACLRAANLTPRQVAHTYAVVDAFVYGFVLQEITLPFDSGPEAAEFVTSEAMGQMIATFPNMAWFVREVVLEPGYTYGREFLPGLDHVLAGLEAAQRQ